MAADNPWTGLKCGWLDFNGVRSELNADGKVRSIEWQRRGGSFFAEDEAGTLEMEKVDVAGGFTLYITFRPGAVKAESLIITPLVFPALQVDHFFCCGERMGRCRIGKFPLASPEEFYGRYCSTLSRGDETVVVSTPLGQKYDNVFRAGAVGELLTSYRLDFEFRHLDMPETMELDPITFRCGDGLAILESYGEESAEREIEFTEAPECGWNSWDYYRWTITEEETIKNAEFIAADPVLKQYVKRIIVDDGWQYCYGEWEANPDFPSGMKYLADRIHKLGFKPGLWFAPSIVEPHARIAQMDYDMLACSEGGQPCICYECMKRFGFVLDPTVPKSQRFLEKLFDRYAGMGYEYFKLDFLGSTMMAARFADRSVPRAGILRLLMNSVCKGVDGRASLLGCNYHFYNGNAFVDSVRVGGDIHSIWSSVCRNTVSVAGMFWANKRLWINDPDFALCRSLETSDDPDIGRLKASLVSVSADSPYNELFYRPLCSTGKSEQEVLLSLVIMAGGAVNLSDNMPRLNALGVEMARKVVSAESGFNGRPLDIFSSVLPVYWTQELKQGRRLLVVNWSDDEQVIPIDWKKVGGKPGELRDFWQDKVEKAADAVELPPHSCKLWEY